MRNTLAVALIAVVISACSTMAALDRGVTSLEPLYAEDGYRYFTYQSLASPVYPLDSPDAERIRMNWLEDWLEDNGLKNRPYEILDRTPINQVGLSYKIYYRVRVKE